LQKKRKSNEHIFKGMNLREECYSLNIFESLKKTVILEDHYYEELLAWTKLQEGMILNQNLFSPSGALLISKGQEFGEAALTRLENIFKKNSQIPKVKVLVTRNNMSL